MIRKKKEEEGPRSLLKLIGDSTVTKSESSFFDTNVDEIGREPRRDLNMSI